MGRKLTDEELADPSIVRVPLTKEMARAQADLYTDMKDRALAAEARVAVLERALKPFAQVPSHGKHGGPFVIASASYEDMCEGDAAPRAAYLHWPAFEAARQALSDKGKADG